MRLLRIGILMFVLGFLVSLVGYWLEATQLGIGPPPGFLEFVLDVIKEWFPKLSEGTVGQRVTAFGTITCALGILLVVIGAVGWLAEKAAGGSDKH